MDNQQREIIRTRIKQIREESPWMEEYEIEAIICAEFSLVELDSSLMHDAPAAPPQPTFTSAAAVRAAARANSPSQVEPPPTPAPQPSTASNIANAVDVRLLENYSEIQKDAIGKFGAYEGRNTGPAQRRDIATRALYDLVKAAESNQEASAVVDKARAVISKNIRQECDRVGIALLISEGIQVAIGLLITVFTVLVMGWNLDEVYNFVTKPSSMALMHAGLLLLAFAFPFVAYLFIHKLPLDEMIPLHKLRSGELLPMVGIGLGVMMVEGVISNYVRYPGLVRGANYSFDAVSFGNNAGDMLLTLFGMGIIPALIETFVFNGVILQVMRRRGGDGFALVFSSLLYMILTANFVDMPGAFISSLILGYMVVFSGSLLPAVVTRLVERLLFFGITQMGFLVNNTDTVQYIDCFITIVLIALGIVAFLAQIKEFPEMFVIKRSDPCLTVAQKIRMSVVRVPILILIALAVVTSAVQLFDLDFILAMFEKYVM